MKIHLKLLQEPFLGILWIQIGKQKGFSQTATCCSNTVSFLVSHYIFTFQKFQKSWKVLEAFLKNLNILQEPFLFKLQAIMLSSDSRLETSDIVYWNPSTSSVHKKIVTYIKEAADESCRSFYTWPLSGYQTLKA